MHATFTQTGTFVAVPLDDPSLPSYTGKFTIWGGFNANGTTVNGTFTFNLHGTGSDGSTFNTHEVITSTPDPTALSTSSSTATRPDCDSVSSCAGPGGVALSRVRFPPPPLPTRVRPAQSAGHDDSNSQGDSSWISI